MSSKTFLLPLVLLFVSCTQKGEANSRLALQTDSLHKSADISPSSVGDISLPKGYDPLTSSSGSFHSYLRSIKLKADKTVYLYDGRIKPYQGAQYAVLDISRGTQNLQQCADAAMRLRAEFLFLNKRFSEISFTDNESTEYTFSAPYSRERFDKYLLRVFGMCGSASLSRQLKKKSFSAIEPGDIFIRGGFPGHVVIVMDVAHKNGKKIFLLAQSYMPAQDIHILKNPSDAGLSPWYEVNDAAHIITSEYIFKRTELKTW